MLSPRCLSPAVLGTNEYIPQVTLTAARACSKGQWPATNDATAIFDAAVRPGCQQLQDVLQIA
jgi:hypothetical protein